MSDNCRVRLAVIQALEHHFGSTDIDCFASAANAICLHFNSYFTEPGCKSPDMFSAAFFEIRIFRNLEVSKYFDGHI